MKNNFFFILLKIIFFYFIENYYFLNFVENYFFYFSSLSSKKPLFFNVSNNAKNFAQKSLVNQAYVILKFNRVVLFFINSHVLSSLDKLSFIFLDSNQKN